MSIGGGLSEIALTLAVVVLALAAYTQLRAYTFATMYPATGRKLSVDGQQLHFIDIAATDPDAPVLLFIHGASGNLHDPMSALHGALEGRYRLLFVDRPGHGWSERRERADASPKRQAELLGGLMDALGIERAVVVGHSWGGSVAAAFALGHRRKTRGLVFLAPATHPWEGGVNWYYHIAAMPIVGWLFVHILTLPVGLMARRRVTRCVFSPEPMPEDYIEDARIDLVLRPGTFRANAQDVVDLHGHVTAMAPRYPSIAAPTVILSDMQDPVVYTHIHSTGLERDIPGARLRLLERAGHMPHHTRTHDVVDAIDDVVERSRTGTISRDTTRAAEA